MIPAVQKESLCQSCIHCEDCFHLQKMQSKSLTVFFCEEFDDTVNITPPKNIQNVNNGSNQDSNPQLFIKIPGRAKGLCLNCEKRETCRFPPQEGGVWHCEEYS